MNPPNPSLSADRRRTSRLHAPFVLLAGLLLAAASPAARGAPADNYRLRHGDVLEFTVFQEPDLRTQARIQADGTIYLPLVGSVQAEGRTLAGLQAGLTELYDRDFLVQPQITLQIAAYAPRSVQVIGQVNRPGTIPLPAEAPMRLLEAIGAAGGFTRRADAGKVSIRRLRDDGSQEIIEKDVGQLLSRPDANDIVLRDGDTVLVGERWI